ncbi:MAG: PAS domain S-box protein [Planctomycetota bacterium]
MSETSRNSQDLFRLAVELAPAGIIVVDARGRILLVNREVERLFLYRRDELVGKPIELLVPERFRSRHPGDRAQYLADPKARPMGAGRDLFGLRRDGTEVPVEIGLNPVKTDAGLLVLATLVDISARKRAEERFHAAVESAASGMIMVDAAGTIVLVNREAEQLFGYGRDELIGRCVDMLVPERFRGAHPGDRHGFFAEPQARPMGAGRELFGLRRDGTEIAVEIGLNPIHTDDGLLVLSSIVDVTARRRAEHELRESEERFRLLVESVRDYAILMVDPAGNVAGWNAGAENITGYREDEVLGRPLERFFAAADPVDATTTDQLRAAAEKGRSEIEVWRVRKDGSRYFASELITALRDGDGELRGFVKLTRDITERHRLEGQLRQAQKMEAIGTLAGGIAHDFNNILLGIIGYTELAQSSAKDRPQLHDDLGKVLSAAERGRKLVERILLFSRQRDPAHVPIHLEGAIREALQFLRASLPSTIEMREHIDPTTPRVLADETQIYQVLMNLATNAAHAMREQGGVLEVSLEPFMVDEGFARAQPMARRGLHALITVTDTGHGMSPEVLERATEPFFTTKPTGAGTGLGLAVIHGIVASHGGRLQIRSRVGQGTTVEVLLPALETAAADADAPARPAPQVPAGARHILVVEDEEVLADLCRRQLEALGYRVTVHTSSLNALEDFRRQPAEFDLVITDNTMPRMTGLALAQEMLRTDPRARILMVSGIGASMEPEALLSLGVRRVLPKPHTLWELARAVRACLEEEEPAR